MKYQPYIIFVIFCCCKEENETKLEELGPLPELYIMIEENDFNMNQNLSDFDEADFDRLVLQVTNRTDFEERQSQGYTPVTDEDATTSSKKNYQKM